MEIKKMIKKRKRCWTDWGVVITLHGILLSGAIGENLENKQLKKFSNDTIVSNRQKVSAQTVELINSRLFNAQILYDKKDDNLSAVLQTAFNYIEKQRLAFKESYRSLVNMETYIRENGSLDKSLKKQLLDRLETTKHPIERSVSIPSLVARRGGLRKRKCNVLAVNKELDAVILDAGYINGISPGSKWQIRNTIGKTIQLQVVEVRRTICAAVPVDRMNFVIKTGQTAEKAKENTLESKENYGN